MAIKVEAVGPRDNLTVTITGNLPDENYPLSFGFNGAPLISHINDHTGAPLSIQMDGGTGQVVINLSTNPNVTSVGLLQRLGRGIVNRSSTIIPPEAKKTKKKTAPVPPVLSAIEAHAGGRKIVGTTLEHQVLVVAKGKVPGSNDEVPMPGVAFNWTCDGASGSDTTGADGSKWITVPVNTPGQKSKLTVLSGTKTGQCELEGPAEKKKGNWTISADLARPHPVEGWFILTGSTRCDDKPADCTFTAISSPTKVQVKANIGTITPNRGDAFTVTSKGGTFTFSAKFRREEADMVLQLADGTSVTVPMVKPID